MDTRRILRGLYPHLIATRRRPTRPGPHVLLLRPVAWARRNAVQLAAGMLLLVGWLAAHLYYYNLLVDLEFNVHAAWAQVETLRQRRAHIQENLLPLLRKYGKHETQLFTLVSKIRTRQMTGGAGAVAIGQAARQAAGAEVGQVGPPAPPASHASHTSSSGALPALQFLAEQYPQLRLSENFQQVSTAMIDAENVIAEAIKAYNEAVNQYTTVLSQFPGALFGKVCGFGSYEFYAPEPADMTFKAIR